MASLEQHSWLGRTTTEIHDMFKREEARETRDAAIKASRGAPFQKNRMPSYLVGLRDQIYRRNRQGRHMQRLATWQSCFPGHPCAGGRGAASSEIQQGQAT